MTDSPNRLPATGAEQLHDLGPQHDSAVLQYFHRHTTEVVTVDDLVTFIHEQDTPDEGDLRTAARLHHLPLPALAENGTIDYEWRSNTVRYRGHPAGGVSE